MLTSLPYLLCDLLLQTDIEHKKILHFQHNMKSWSVRKCTGCGRVPFAQFHSQQLMRLGYNMASTYCLIRLLVLRGDYSTRELFKHITLFSFCSSEAKSNRSLTTTATVSWVTAEVELRIISNECFTPKHDQMQRWKGLMSAERMQHINTKIKKYVTGKKKFRRHNEVLKTKRHMKTVF